MTKYQAIDYVLTYFNESETNKSEALSRYVLNLIRSSLNEDIDKEELHQKCENIRLYGWI
jgi:hypothetical protein